MATSKQVGSSADVKPRTWVQTERSAHEAWLALMNEAPAAAKLMHLLCARMSASSNAVVASQRVLSDLCGIHRTTVVKAGKELERRRWIERVQLGGKGGAIAYVVNDRVAWSRPRKDMPRVSRFSATVVAAENEQESGALDEQAPLRQVPMLMRGEEPLPAGSGEPPPSQAQLDGTEPYIVRDEDGLEWEADPETGELQQRIERSE
jgi:DNA-binding transcriptional MocR family regulator